MATAIAIAAVDASVPTRVVLPLDVDKVPSPVCSQCTAGTKKVSASSGGPSTGAVVTFTFRDYDDLDAYVGGVRITVRLNDGSYRDVYSDFMTIADGQTVTFELDNGDDWTWDDVPGDVLPDVEVVFFELTDPQ